jgi:hypothetical protein
MRREKAREENAKRFFVQQDKLRRKRRKTSLSGSTAILPMSCSSASETGGWQTERRDENRTKLSAAGFNLGVK